MNPSEMHLGKLIAPIVVVMIVVGLVAYWYFIYRAPELSPAGTSGEGNAPLSNEVKQNDLGVQLYENSQNPVKDKLPSTAATVPNPIENAYKNPFE